MSESKLKDQIKLGSHLGAMTSDGMLVSALNVFDETKGGSLQDSIDNVYTKSEVDTKLGEVEVDLSDYYTKEEADSKITEKIAQAKLDGSEVDLSSYATKSEVAETYQVKGNYLTSEQADAKFLTSHQSLDGKADKKHTHSVKDIVDLNPEDYGKVKDVVVGEESILDEEGIARIVFPASPDLSPYATKTELSSKANTADVYNKTTIDTKLEEKVNTSSLTALEEKVEEEITRAKAEEAKKANLSDLTPLATKAEVTKELEKKANLTEVYTQEKINELLLDKADNSKVYSKGDVDGLLEDKASKDSVYTKEDINTKLGEKANASVISTLATKTALEDGLKVKANQSDTFTKTEVTEKLDLKVDTTKLTAELAKKAETKHTHTTDEITGIPTGTLATQEYVTTAIAKAQLEGEEIDLSTFLTTDAANQLYQPKGKYLEEHQDITGKADVGHKHKIADITDLNLDNYGKVKDVKVNDKSVFSEATGIASIDLTPYAKTSDVSAAYQEKGEYLTAKDITGKADTNHSHTTGDITDLTEKLNLKANLSDIPRIDNLVTDESLEEKLEDKADNDKVIHNEGDERIAGNKTFQGITEFSYSRSLRVDLKAGVSDRVSLGASGKGVLSISELIVPGTDNTYTTIAKVSKKSSSSSTIESANSDGNNYELVTAKAVHDYIEDKLTSIVIPEVDEFVTETDLETKLDEKAEKEHKHTSSQITDLDKKLEPYAKTEDLSRYSTTDHKHSVSDIEGLEIKVTDVKVGEESVVTDGVAKIDLSGYVKTTTYTSGLAGKANVGDSHTKQEITTLLANKVTTTALNAALESKVDSDTLTEELKKKANTSDLSGLVNETKLTTELSTKADKSSLTSLATKEELSKKADKEGLFSGKYGDLKEIPTNILTTTVAEETYQKLGDYVETSALESYVTSDALEKKNYLTKVPSNYITSEALESKGYLIESNLEGYIKETEADEKYLTFHQPLTDYYTKTQANAEFITPTKLAEKNYVTSTELADKSYATTADLTTILGSAKEYTDSMASGAMIWKGVKETKAELEALEEDEKRVGDFWTVTDENKTEYAWNGNEWLNIGSDIDFSKMTRDINDLETSLAEKASLLDLTKETNRATAAEKVNAGKIEEITEALNGKAEVSALEEESTRAKGVENTKADKTYVNEQLALKANSTDLTNLVDQDTLDEALLGKAEKTHTHTSAQVTDLTNTLAPYAKSANVYTQAKTNELLDKKVDKTTLSEYLTIESAEDTYQTKGNFVTVDGLAGKNYITAAALSPYLTEEKAGETYQTIGDFVTTTELNKKNYVTERALEEKGYLTAVPEGYVTTTVLEAVKKDVEKKANSADVYTKTAANSTFVSTTQLAGKNYIDATTLESKNYVDEDSLTETLEDYVTTEVLSGKGYATTSEVNKKANSSEVYSKEEADQTFLTIANFKEMTEEEILAICE